MRAPSATDVICLLFLGILIGFHVTRMETLCHRLLKAAAAFHAHYAILMRSTADSMKRVLLFTTFVTSRWRWMSCAFRPTKAIRKALDVMQTTSVLLGHPYQEFEDMQLYAERLHLSRAPAAVHALTFIREVHEHIGIQKFRRSLIACMSWAFCGRTPPPRHIYRKSCSFGLVGTCGSLCHARTCQGALG